MKSALLIHDHKLNRPTGITYSGSTHAIAYTYDGRDESERFSHRHGGRFWSSEPCTRGHGGVLSDDAWGNLSEIEVSDCTAASLSITVSSTTNRVTTTGFSYDAAGNMTSEPAPNGYTYTYDAENHLTQAAGTSTGTWTYVYDGNGLRVEKSNASGGTLYWRDVLGNSIAETDLTGSTSDSAYEEYVFFAGRRIAQVPVDKWGVLYYYADQVGSTVLLTLGPGQNCYQATFTPYGQEMATENTCSTNYKFTGYERDAETGLDYAFARFYNSRLGRFMSPDPLGGSLGDPQSLNRYAYVENSPTNSTDPSGMFHYCPVKGGGCDWGDGNNCVVDFNPTNCGGGLFGLEILNGDIAQCPDNSCPIGLLYTSQGFGYLAPPSTSNIQMFCAGTWASPTGYGCSVVYGGYAFIGGPSGFQPVPGDTGTAANNGQPQTPTQPKRWYQSCGAQAAGNALTHVGLDAIGAINPQLGALAGGVSMLINRDPNPTGQVIGGYGFLVVVGNGFKSVEWAAKAAPLVGNILAAGSAVYDAYGAFKQYQACKAGGG